MKVVAARPPVYDAIVAQIGRPPAGAIYTWGDTIYAPSGHPPGPDLMEHEAVHEQQQRAHGGPEAWWTRYLADPGFRLQQELEAYRQQYGWIKSHVTVRAHRRRMLADCARALSGGMYGRVITYPQAIEAIKVGAA